MPLCYRFACRPTTATALKSNHEALCKTACAFGSHSLLNLCCARVDVLARPPWPCVCVCGVRVCYTFQATACSVLCFACVNTHIFFLVPDLRSDKTNISPILRFLFGISIEYSLRSVQVSVHGLVCFCAFFPLCLMRNLTCLCYMCVCSLLVC